MRLSTIAVNSSVTLLFFAATFLVYGSSLRNEFVSWDDTSLITENDIVLLADAKGVKKAFTTYDPELYIPLTFLSYQLTNRLCGISPACFHGVDLVLHTVNALLVTVILYALLGSSSLAVALGLLFALHPLNTEAVAWASARKDTLSTTFFLLSLHCYALFLERSSVPDSTTTRIFSAGRWSYALCLVCFTLALLTKVMTVTLPAVLLLLDWLHGREDRRRMLVEKIPFLLLALTFGIIALFGKAAILVHTTLLQKVLVAAGSFIFYIVKFIAPTRLAVMVPYTDPVSMHSIDLLLCLVIVFVIAVIAVALRKRMPWFTFGAAFYAVTVAPTFLNFAKGGDIYLASDRYAYIPMFGLLFLVGAGLQAFLLSRPPLRLDAAKAVITTAFVMLLLFFGYRSSVQAATWRDSTTLYENVLHHYPNSAAAHNNLGMEHLQRGNYTTAIEHFDHALAVRSDPKTRVNRAYAFAQKGDEGVALAEYLDIIADTPEMPDAYSGIGSIKQKNGNLSEAVYWYKKALGVDERYLRALNNLGATYLLQQEWQRARDTFESSLVINPHFPSANYNLAIAHEYLGNLEAAETSYRKAILLRPADPDAKARLATLLYDRQSIPEAAELLKEALRIEQEHPIGHALLSRMVKDGIVR